jgi:3-hydroxyacyl-[acyl-carrier-protein] dehydratase
MEGPVETEAGMRADFKFPEEFIGFQGHFPANKVLPGACQVQCVLSTIETVLEKRTVLKEIILAKYVAPILPDDSVTCTVIGMSDAANEPVFKVKITKGTEKISELKLRVSLDDAI